MPDAPAVNGISGRISPIQRPMKTVFPPCLWKKSSTFLKRSFVSRTFGPCLSANSRPSRRPSWKPIASPITHDTHVIPISSWIESVPCPARTPPRMIVNSPGATKPTKAAVSAIAMKATSR